MVGDVKSPADFSLLGCDYWSIERQRKLPFGLAEQLPANHYARKNLGYLIAMNRGAEVIIETDDDNYPMEVFWSKRVATQECQQWVNSGWVNVYRWFSDSLIWPRGFPLEHIKDHPFPIDQSSSRSHFCPIHQGLVNGNPDVDAIYRLTCSLPHDFKQANPLVVGQGCWSPFNSQNTTWFKEAFMLLYLPSTCSFRMSDVWRGLVALRICWANDWGVLFHSPTVKQVRNQHHLIDDFSAELPGYLWNKVISDQLSQVDIVPGQSNIPENLFRCYHQFLRLDLIQQTEMELLATWAKDVEMAGAALN